MWFFQISQVNFIGLVQREGNPAHPYGWAPIRCSCKILCHNMWNMIKKLLHGWLPEQDDIKQLSNTARGLCFFSFGKLMAAQRFCPHGADFQTRGGREKPCHIRWLELHRWKLGFLLSWILNNVFLGQHTWYLYLGNYKKLCVCFSPRDEIGQKL